jgi:hypothetical protein
MLSPHGGVIADKGKNYNEEKDIKYFLSGFLSGIYLYDRRLLGHNGEYEI